MQSLLVSLHLAEECTCCLQKPMQDNRSLQEPLGLAASGQAAVCLGCQPAVPQHCLVSRTCIHSGTAESTPVGRQSPVSFRKPEVSRLPNNVPITLEEKTVIRTPSLTHVPDILWSSLCHCLEASNSFMPRECEGQLATVYGDNYFMQEVGENKSSQRFVNVKTMEEVAAPRQKQARSSSQTHLDSIRKTGVLISAAPLPRPPHTSDSNCYGGSKLTTAGSLPFIFPATVREDFNHPC